jgi:anti-sigma B factor antagonist
MWNPFSRRSVIDVLAQNGGGTAVLDQPVTSSVIHNKIAQVQRMGQSAVATLTVTELTQEQGVQMLTELLDELEQTGAIHFVLDIQNVQFMDSACLGCLVQALNRMARTGGRIALANTANSVQYLFRMTQLDRVFPICSDVMAALTAVERPQRGRH